MYFLCGKAPLLLKFITATSNSSGQRFTKEEEEKITEKWIDWYVNLCGEHARLYNEFLSDEDPHKKYSLPPAPLKVLPETTSSCIERGYCYHREYVTNDWVSIWILHWS
jgi:hypothetical protein